MASHIEIELKWALSPTGYEQLKQALINQMGPGIPLSQDNRFFDTVDRRLRRSLLNIRLRRENDGLLLTCKGKLPTGPAGAHQHQEWETWLDPKLWPLIAAGDLSRTNLPLPAPIEEALAGAPLMALGGFCNERLCFNHSTYPAALLCLDRTNFGANRFEHELEIESEYPEACADKWRAQLNEWQIPFTQQPITKFARFLNYSQNSAPESNPS